MDCEDRSRYETDEHEAPSDESDELQWQRRETGDHVEGGADQFEEAVLAYAFFTLIVAYLYFRDRCAQGGDVGGKIAATMAQEAIRRPNSILGVENRAWIGGRRVIRMTLRLLGSYRPGPGAYKG